MSIIRHITVWIAVTVTVMFVLLFAVAGFASECSGMALCMILFLIVNPIYSAILGFRCGRNIRQMWNLPLVSSIAFLAGTWLFFDIKEVWFIIYASVYLIIGWTAMGISKYLNRKHNRIFWDFVFADSWSSRESFVIWKPKYNSAFLRLLVIRSIKAFFRLVSTQNFAVNICVKGCLIRLINIMENAVLGIWNIILAETLLKHFASKFKNHSKKIL